MKKIFLSLLLLCGLLFGSEIEQLEQEAQKGDAKAQNNLGFMYYKGEGMPQDLKKAAYWVEKAYNNGFEQAQKAWNILELWRYK